MIDAAVNAAYWLAGFAGTGVIAFALFLLVTRPRRRRG